MKTVNTFAVLLVALLGNIESGQCFYNPQAGRWLNREPIGDSGFRLLSSTTRNAEKQEIQLFAFLDNTPISSWDYLGLDNPGCDFPIWALPGSTESQLRCCAQHDACFFDHHCRAWSSWPLVIVPCTPCGTCNRKVVACLIGCMCGAEPNNPPYFCPNGPFQDRFYYNWNDIPPECWEDGVRPDRPEGYP